METPRTIFGPRGARRSSTAQSVSLSTFNYNQLNSLLLRLPAEIRLHIYSFVITSEKASYIRSHGSSDERDIGKRTKQNGREDIRHDQRNGARSFTDRYSGLLLTCRQTYSEARLLPFQLVTLVFTSDGIVRAKPYLTAEQKRAMRYLRLIVTLRKHRSWETNKTPFLEDAPIPLALARLSGLRRLTIEIRHEQRAWAGKQDKLATERESALKWAKFRASHVLGDGFGGMVEILTVDKWE